jgi:hypothetical protein
VTVNDELKRLREGKIVTLSRHSTGGTEKRTKKTGPGYHVPWSGLKPDTF